MSSNSLKSSLFLRHFLWRLMAVTLLVYLCADVSLFEYYEGNLALGIISYRQSFKLCPPNADSAGLPDEGDSLDSFYTKTHADTDNLLFDDNDCFCCTAHAAHNPVRFTITLLPLINKRGEPNFIDQQSDSDCHSPPFYRPPRTI